jgi:hypothetical protein
MAFAIFQSCPNRYITKSSILMQHQMSLQIKGNIVNINSYMELIKNINDDIDELQAIKLKIPIEEFKKKLNNDWWMNYKSIIKSNAADNIAFVICNNEIVDMTEIIVISTIFVDVTVKFSKCPISREPIEIKYHGKFNSVTISESLILEIENNIIPAKFIKNLVNNYM